jgi:hypothetical protein
MKAKINRYSAIAATLLTTLHARGHSSVPTKLAPAATHAAAAIPSGQPVADNPGVLDERRRFALSMIETGGDDHEIGRAGEVSRYQIMPSVWRHYSDSQRYHDPETSTEVAQQHWTALYNGFKQQARCEPTDFDMYVLWNTHYGYYANRGFKPARLNAVVRERAQRFVNLIQRGAA